MSQTDDNTGTPAAVLVLFVGVGHGSVPPLARWIGWPGPPELEVTAVVLGPAVAIQIPAVLGAVPHDPVMRCAVNVHGVAA